MNYNNNDREDNFVDNDLSKNPSENEAGHYSNIPEGISREEKPREVAKKKTFKGSISSYIILALVASIIGGLSVNYLNPLVFKNSNKNSPTYSPANMNPININTSDDINTVSAVVKKSMKSVVGITTLETVDDFFGFGEKDRGGLGSGVIFDSNGYILTNSHVVLSGNAKEIKVLFDNGEQVNGNLLWFDPALDLAVVKVDVRGLPAMELGDSDSLEVGELAIAIGNPLGLEFQRTVTSGIISGLNRNISVDQNTIMDNLIQTDASINPGNSGGPLLNAKGQVVGINTAKIQSGEGLGFAIPINATKSILQEVVEKGTFKTVQLGIKGLDIKEYQSRLGVDLNLEKGAIILEVIKNSPAQKGGLISGDIILKIDKTEVESMQSLKKTLYDYTEGDKVTLTILRNAKKENIEISF